MLNCHDATRLMSESQERPLSIFERMSLKVHLMMCSGCSNFKEQMGSIRSMSKAFAKGKNEREKM
jgi:heterodisulfide reductase subunit B